MVEIIKDLFETRFMPHGHCYFWNPIIVWANAISDSVIALSYFTIPITLLYIVRLRKDMNFKFLLALFAVFILGCGATHIMDVINIWNPFYQLDSAFRIITAIASVGTAIMLVKITPQILVIPNAEVYQKINTALQEQIRELEEKDKTIELLVKNREMENALKQSEIRFQLMADNIANLAWIARADGYLIWYNRRWYEYTGTTQEEMEGWGWQRVIEEKALSVVLEKWKYSIESRQPFEMVIPLRSSEGVNHLFLTKAMPVMDELGHVINWVGTNTDITGRIKVEMELKDKNKELQLINNDLDNFIYSASHDLKAPISNIEGLVNELVSFRKEPFPEDEQEIIAMIYKSISKFKSTVEDLTNITKLQKDIAGDLVELNISQVIEEVKDSIDHEMRRSGALIFTDLQINSIYFTKKNLTSILYNLISNGIKYKNSAPPVIQIHTERVKNQLMLVVRDNGIGIDMANKDKIFGMFKRLHTHVEGSGIGLYIVKKIVDNNGGAIEVESRLEEGTIFRIFLSGVFHN